MPNHYKESGFLEIRHVLQLVERCFESWTSFVFGALWLFDLLFNSFTQNLSGLFFVVFLVFRFAYHSAFGISHRGDGYSFLSKLFFQLNFICPSDSSTNIDIIYGKENPH